MDLIKTLMRRDGLSRSEALELVEELREQVLEGADPEDALYSVGLEPDYIFDLLDGVI
jgi:predicted nucleic acid-binding protein